MTGPFPFSQQIFYHFATTILPSKGTCLTLLTNSGRPAIDANKYGDIYRKLFY